MTWNPFIALAFATHGAVDGDLGVVALLSRPEWNSRLAAVAPLDLVELDLRRPRQQQAEYGPLGEGGGHDPAGSEGRRTQLHDP